MTGTAGVLDQAFQALANPTRRAVIERLASGPASVSELADPFEMALPSFVQHLRVLEQSGLVRSEKRGRVRTYHAQMGHLKDASNWLATQRDMWEMRLDQLDAYVTKLEHDND